MDVAAKDSSCGFASGSTTGATLATGAVGSAPPRRRESVSPGNTAPPSHPVGTSTSVEGREEPLLTGAEPRPDGPFPAGPFPDVRDSAGRP
ncbi:MAG: hypothetical protein WA374_01445, partial [Acidobacteriaceae bacterium]